MDKETLRTVFTIIRYVATLILGWLGGSATPII